MLARICVLLVAIILVVSVIECVWDLSPLEQAGRAFEDAPAGAGQRTLIRLGIASWQLGEFPWKETIARYEQANPGVRIRL
ncbi:MAG: hypothetical protein ACYS5V_04525, partial [Planctomycetota bacterium]